MMSNPFFDRPVPYICPQRHWELDADGYGYGPAGPLHLVVENKCDWAFDEFTEVFQIQADFKATVDAEFNKLIKGWTP